MRATVVWLLIAGFACCSATDIFVSPSGDDKMGDGSIDRPFATIYRAQEAVRKINQAMREDIHVYFREGSYFLPTPATFTQIDSGFNGFTVHYQAYKQEAVTLHSGVVVTQWQNVPGTKIWSASLPAGVNDTRQIYINGDRMVPTNTQGHIPGNVQITDTGYTTTDPLDIFFVPQQNPSDIEFLYTGVGSSWTECRLRVQSISRSAGKTTITMQQPGFHLGRNRFYGQAISAPVAITNLYALLGPSTAGQYYFNSAQKKIYYVPRSQDDMATAQVIVPSSDVIVLVQGAKNRTATDPVKFLSFEGLKFEYSGWLEPNSGLGYVDMQSAFRVMPESTSDDTTWPPVPGNLQFHTVENITITNCIFAHLGATAIQVDDASQSVTVRNNTFYDISCGGVYVGQVNDVNQTDPLRENGYFLIDDNYFAGIPVEFHDCAVILGGFVIKSNITHNSVLNNANTAISLGWGWSRDEASNAGWNYISYNYVYGSNWLLEDGGSLYVLGPQPQSVMSYNYLSNQKKLYGALYTDEGSAYWHITRNVVNDCPEWLHIWTASIHDEVVDFCWSNQRYQIVAGTRITITNITFIDPGKPFPPEAQDVIANAGVSWMYGPKP